MGTTDLGVEALLSDGCAEDTDRCFLHRLIQPAERLYKLGPKKQRVTRREGGREWG
jgi:hypothetical protein